MPAERRAQFRFPNVPTSRISERAPFRIYEHAQCPVFERTSLQRAYVITCRKWGRPLCCEHSVGRGCRVHACVMAIRADFEMYRYQVWESLAFRFQT